MAINCDKKIKELLPKRKIDCNKYSVGSALIIAGSQGMSGAALMASMAAYRIGAGIVTTAVPQSIQNVIAIGLPEALVLPLPETKSGNISLKSLDIVLEKAQSLNAVLIGCGLSKNLETQKFVIEFLKNCNKPIVVDADGLNALENNIEIIQKFSKNEWILTPHTGELKRLLKERYSENKLDLAKNLAKEWNCTLIIKGLPSIVGFPNGEAHTNTTGNPALAKAGTGDVLAGMCVGLLAQGLTPEAAALSALNIGGACADEYIKKNDARSMIATDLIKLLPVVMKERFK